MDWDGLLAAFRDLGGVAENVRMGNGKYGRGLFVIDPALPVRLHTPEHLLVPTGDVEIRDGRMLVKPTSEIGDRERAFFEEYQQCFGWGAGLYDELRQAQDAWSRLPADLIAFIKTMGVREDLEWRFLAPTPDVCLREYVRSRNFTYREKAYLNPIVELGNHSSGAAGYHIDRGAGIEGSFHDEIFARYNSMDSWGRAIGYGFSDTGVFAHSLIVTVTLYERTHLSIRRDPNDVEFRNGIRFPNIKLNAGVVTFPFLTLGFTAAPDVPRAVFRTLMSTGFPAVNADDVFDSVAHFNRTKFLELLRLLRRYDGPIVEMLTEAAINQLETMSYCVGARAL
jgi:hypothetical protein